MPLRALTLKLGPSRKRGSYPSAQKTRKILLAEALPGRESLIRNVGADRWIYHNTGSLFEEAEINLG